MKQQRFSEKDLFFSTIWCILREKVGEIMSRFEKQLLFVLCGTKDSNISFTELQSILDQLGFQCRVKGDHFIYTKEGIQEIINIQPKGNKAKPYQVKQIRNIILKYQLGGDLNV